MPSPAPQSSLNLPDAPQPSRRPPSPLRNAFVPDSSTGINPASAADDESDDEDPSNWGRPRSTSPASSVSHLAASFVQRMGTFVGQQMAQRTPGGSMAMMTDAELEADAERERDRGRREAEVILTREADERRRLEERMLAAMHTTRSLPPPQPPPPTRSQTLPNTPSPASSHKEPSWWTAAKNRLTPTKDKEPLTPAQQVIQDAKAREKDKKVRGKEREKDWPGNTTSKYTDPAFLNLNPPPATPVRRPPAASSSPTPSRPSSANMPPNLSPSPMRLGDSASASPSREAPPLYAKFNSQGTLDVPVTLITIATRFEKLEKWTVGHVRALEDRMSDVERWLVDKEKANEVPIDSISPTDPSDSKALNMNIDPGLKEIRDEVEELQGRVRALGREMAILASASSSVASRAPLPPDPVQTTPPSDMTGYAQTLLGIKSIQDSDAVNVNANNNIKTPHRPRLSSASDSTTPPLASNGKNSGTRLPYPTGDYTSPSESFSPSHSPQGSASSKTRAPRLSLASGIGLGISASNESLDFLSRAVSPTVVNQNIGNGNGAGTSTSTSAFARVVSPPQNHALPLPRNHTPRQNSTSPTPRKRYTVALGQPISNASTPQEIPGVVEQLRSSSSSEGSSSILPLASSSSVVQVDEGDADSDVFRDDVMGKDVMGKVAVGRLGRVPSVASLSGGKGYRSLVPLSLGSGGRRPRPQSAFGASLGGSATGVTTALKINTRARSTERFGNGGGSSGSSRGGGQEREGGGRFVDPLVLRRKESKETTKIVMPKPVGKVPIGQLVAFFDEQKGK